jgi:hypothetical protein
MPDTENPRTTRTNMNPSERRTIFIAVLPEDYIRCIGLDTAEE